MTEAERAEIERACEKLSIAYARHVDFRDYQALAGLFAEDGVLELFGRQIRGRAAVLAALSARPENRKSLHIFTNISTDVIDADHARGLTYLTLLRADHDGEGAAPLDGPLMGGYYEDEFIRTQSGWRIARRKATILFARKD